MKNFIFAFVGAYFLLGYVTSVAHAQLNVVTTLPSFKYLVEQVGGDQVSVDAIAKGSQDPHYIEAKPSYMVKASRADLIIADGLDLEVGWLPSIVNGSRNPNIRPGSNGYLEVGPLLNPLEVPQSKVTRAEGDVHPFGNPHFYLDPIRMGNAAVIIANRLSELDSKHAEQFKKVAASLQKHFQEKTQAWQERVKKSGVKQVVTYHKTLTYFFDRFGIENPAILEPKPGIPPTSGHIIDVIKTIKERKIPLILVENFFDSSVTNKIKQEVPSIRVESVPVEIGGESGIKTLDDLYEALVKAVAGK